MAGSADSELVNVGGQPETETSDVDATADEQVASAPAQGDASANKREDWWSTDGLDERAAKRVKSIQTEYNKKAERLSELEKKVTLVDEYEQRNRMMEQEIVRAIQDPNYYKQIRKQHGFHEEEAPKVEFDPTSIKTVEDLTKFVESKVAEGKREAEMIFEQKLNRIAEPVARDRWVNALNKIRSEDEDFAKYEKKVLFSIAHGEFKGLANSMEEDKVLKLAYNALTAQERIEAAKKAALQERQVEITKKKNGSTATPKKHVPTGSLKSDLKEDIIARVRSRFDS